MEMKNAKCATLNRSDNMPGKRHREKGNRVERSIVNMHHDHGIHAERVPLSGQAGGSFSGDLVIACKYRAEVKARKSGEGFATIERWLGDNDMLFLRRDRKPPIVVMGFEVYSEILNQAFLEPRIAPNLIVQESDLD